MSAYIPDPHEPAEVRRVRGLLAKAEGTDNPLEADAFLAKAMELMDRYRLTMADVRPEPHVARTRYPLAAQAKYLRPSSALLGCVAEHYGCIVLIATTGNRKVVDIVGDTDDITATVMMFESLVRQRDRMILRVEMTPGDNPNRFRNSFAYGFAATIDERLKELRRIYEDHSTGAGLVLANRTQAVRDALDFEVKTINQNKATVDGVGLAIGGYAGHQADLGQDRLDGPVPEGLQALLP